NHVPSIQPTVTPPGPAGIPSRAYLPYARGRTGGQRNLDRPRRASRDPAGREPGRGRVGRTGRGGLRTVIVAIEGIDGAGKRTLTEALLAALAQAGRKAGTLAFPRYAVAPLGPAVRAMLTGDPALAPVAASARASALMFALDRANAGPELSAAATGDAVVLVDRYVASNA